MHSLIGSKTAQRSEAAIAAAFASSACIMHARLVASSLSRPTTTQRSAISSELTSALILFLCVCPPLSLSLSPSQVDFVELIERLNVLHFGSKSRKLSALFSVYDLDGSGRISRQELEQVIAALGHRDEQTAHETAQRLLATADANHDGQLSQAEFLSLADGEHAGFSLWNTAVKKHFGLLH